MASSEDVLRMKSYAVFYEGVKIYPNVERKQSLDGLYFDHRTVLDEKATINPWTVIQAFNADLRTRNPFWADMASKLEIREVD